MKNIGNPEGFNFGARQANGENLVILEEDIIVPNNNWLQVMFNALQDYPDLAYVSPMWSGVLDSLKNKMFFEKTSLRNQIIRFILMNLLSSLVV